MLSLAVLAALASSVLARGVVPDDNQLPFAAVGDSSKPLLEDLWGEAWPFQGASSFAHLPYHLCLVEPNTTFDIAIVGVPFDTATTYRAGARFGPRAIRAASARQTLLRGYNPRAGVNPYLSWAKVVDCGDIPVTPMDNNLALRQMLAAFDELLLARNVSADGAAYQLFPRLIALGGDHLVLLPHMRALSKLYPEQLIHVIHFDAHLDTWAPSKYPLYWHLKQLEFTHGLMLWLAQHEGLISKTNNVHIGLRTRLLGPEDNEEDDDVGFLRFSADDVWTHPGGLAHMVDSILEAIPADAPVYILVDIDLLDPGFAPGTGTIEPGGLLPRELIHMLRKFDLLNLVGADVVEVNPLFDHAEITATNGAQVAYELATSMVKKGKLHIGNTPPDVTPLEVQATAPRLRLGDGGVQPVGRRPEELLEEVETQLAQLAALRDQLASAVGAL